MVDVCRGRCGWGAEANCPGSPREDALTGPKGVITPQISSKKNNFHPSPPPLRPSYCDLPLVTCSRVQSQRRKITMWGGRVEVAGWDVVEESARAGKTSADCARVWASHAVSQMATLVYFS